MKLSQGADFPVGALIPLLNIMNRLERVADQAKSICQEVLYMCTGEYLKHAGSDVFRVLFVDEDNGGVSQMAEAIGNSLGQPRFLFASAGLGRGSLDPAVVAFLQEKGLDTSGHGRTVDQVPHLDHYQVIVGLTKDARRIFPPPPTKAVCIEWSVADPSKDASSPEQARGAYEQTYRFLVNHVRDLVEAVVQDQDH